MKHKIRLGLLVLSLFVVVASAFTMHPKHEAKKFDTVYAWFTPGSNPTFIRLNTLADEESVTGYNTTAAGGTLQENGYSSKDMNNQPVGSIQRQLFSHP